MKKTLFNASLEESMNLVTDKYIENSIEDVCTKRISNKIIGLLIINFFMYLVTLLGGYTDQEMGILLFISSRTLLSIPWILGLTIFVYYCVELTQVRRYRILSYYIFNKNASMITILFYIQIELIFVIFISSVLGAMMTLLIFVPIFILVGMERIMSFKRETFKVLYSNEPSNNHLNNFLDKFVIFSKKYGGIAVLLLFVVRFLFRSSFRQVTGNDIYHNDLLRMIAILGAPFIGLIGFYFITAFATSHIQGYYIKKYIEDYRQLSGYSIEEWYGLTSKQYKESLKK